MDSNHLLAVQILLRLGQQSHSSKQCQDLNEQWDIGWDIRIFRCEISFSFLLQGTPFYQDSLKYFLVRFQRLLYRLLIVLNQCAFMIILTFRRHVLLMKCLKKFKPFHSQVCVNQQANHKLTLKIQSLMSHNIKTHKSRKCECHDQKLKI